MYLFVKFVSRFSVKNIGAFNDCCRDWWMCVCVCENVRWYRGEGFGKSCFLK